MNDPSRYPGKECSFYRPGKWPASAYFPVGWSARSGRETRGHTAAVPGIFWRRREQPACFYLLLSHSNSSWTCAMSDKRWVGRGSVFLFSPPPQKALINLIMSGEGRLRQGRRPGRTRSSGRESALMRISLISAVSSPGGRMLPLVVLQWPRSWLTVLKMPSYLTTKKCSAAVLAVCPNSLKQKKTGLLRVSAMSDCIIGSIRPSIVEVCSLCKHRQVFWFRPSFLLITLFSLDLYHVFVDYISLLSG